MFSSKLPVPTSSSSSSTVRPKSAVKAYAPSTIKKPNLFTPQANKIKQRPSVTTERKFLKDARPLQDPAYQQKCFRRLVLFLEDHEYPHPLPDAKKFFHSITTTELGHLFEFLICFILEDFKITRSVDQDVPPALKLLKYPFTVTKSNLVSVASRQSVATLLGIFDYLITFIEKANTEFNLADYVQFDEDGAVLEPDGTINARRSLIHIQLTTETEAEKYEAIRKLADKIYGTEDEVLEMEAEVEELKGEIAELDRKLQEAEDQEVIFEELGEDIKKMEKYQQDLDEHNKSEQARLAAIRQEIADEIEKIKILDEENRQLQMKVDNQEFGPEDAQWHAAEVARIQKNIRDLDADIERINRVKEATGAELSKDMDQTVKELEEHRSKLMNLRDTLENIKRSKSAWFTQDDVESILTSLKPVLQKLDQQMPDDPQELYDLSEYIDKNMDVLLQREADLRKKALENADKLAREIQHEEAILGKKEEDRQRIRSDLERVKMRLQQVLTQGAAEIEELDSQIELKKLEEARLDQHIMDLRLETEEAVRKKKEEYEEIEKRRKQELSKKMLELFATAESDRRVVEETAREVEATKASLTKVREMTQNKKEESRAAVESLPIHLRKSHGKRRKQ